jgi:DNA polymerase III epsilon subunit-like protein
MLIFDTETTGLVQPTIAGLAAQPHIIEFACIKVDLDDMSIVGQVDFLCKPPIQIPPIITKITGITQSQLDGLDPFSSHFNEIAQLFIGESEGVCHNAQFDFSLLEFEIDRMGKLAKFPWPIRRCCTVEATTHILNHRMKLCDLYQHATGRPMLKAHRAMDDVIALWEVVQWMHAEGMPL